MPQPSAHKQGLSVFVPAYNDSGTIASLVISALQAARRLTDDFEVIVINDGSEDATADIADELARTYPEVRVLHHQQNRGYGAALRSGFAAATRDLIFYTDGDAQYDPAEMATLPVLSSDRTSVQSHLRQSGVETLIHYPIPIPQQPAVASEHPDGCPVAARVCQQVLSLPLYPALQDSAVARVAGAFARAASAGSHGRNEPPR